VTCGGQYFRAGAGAIITNQEGFVLALERASIPGAWQLPQGGLEVGEEPLQAVVREIREETGILPAELELIGTYPEPLAYELPPAARSPKTGRGQVQHWFLFKLKGSNDAIRLSRGSEFRAWRWMPFQQLADQVVEFRRPVYRRLAAYFADHLDPGQRPGQPASE
jgi:putative (di)nucleoside polyphosphate hydrolase